MKPARLCVLILLLSATSVRGEKIYAISGGPGGALHLTRIDSASPSSLEM
jgi:hypothetical protein